MARQKARNVRHIFEPSEQNKKREMEPQPSIQKDEGGKALEEWAGEWGGA